MFRPERVFSVVLTGILLLAPSAVHASSWGVTLAPPGVLALDVSGLGLRQAGPACPPTEDVEKKDCDPIELPALELGVRLFAYVLGIRFPNPPW